MMTADSIDMDCFLLEFIRIAGELVGPYMEKRMENRMVKSPDTSFVGFLDMDFEDSCRGYDLEVGQSIGVVLGIVSH